MKKFCLLPRLTKKTSPVGFPEASGRAHIKNPSSGGENAVSGENDLTTIAIFKNCEIFRIINSKEKEFNFQDEVLQEINSDELST